MIDIDILKAELVILRQKEEDLMLELEEVRASMSLYQSEITRTEGI